MANVLVTGAAGFLGSHLVDHLLRSGHRVVVTDLPRADLSRYIAKGVEARPADILSPDSLKTVLAGVDTVIHLAAIFDLGAPEELMWNVNVQGTDHVCRAAVDAGVKKFVMLSSAAVYGKPMEIPCREETVKRPRDAYGVTKWESEKVAMRYHRERGLPVVAVRPSLVYGPGSKYGQAMYFALFSMHRALDRTVWPLWNMPSANQVHIEDVCRAILFLMDRGDAVGQAFNIVDDEPLRLDEGFELIMGQFGVRARRIESPVFAWIARMMCKLLARMPNGFFGPLNRWVQSHWVRIAAKFGVKPELKPRLDRDWLDYLSSERVYDNRKLKSLGFEYAHPKAREGLIEVVQWYRRERWIPDIGSPTESLSEPQKQVA
ncbi:MAG: NAD(P)-dependent oxidoreductase [Nitrospirae bacterium]|nr:NAD(P)-dependent oxidoreductase [Nitrospirota bacterium]